jgi:hypothetical protein
MAFFLPVFFCEIHQKLLKSRSVCNCRRRRTNDLAISIFQFGGASGSPKCDAWGPDIWVLEFVDLLKYPWACCKSTVGLVGSWISGILQLQALDCSFDVWQLVQPSVQISEMASLAMKLNLANSTLSVVGLALLSGQGSQRGLVQSWEIGWGEGPGNGKK